MMTLFRLVGKGRGAKEAKMEAAKKAMKDCIAVIQEAFKNVVEARAHHVLPPEIEQYLNRSTNYLNMAAATIVGLPW